MSRSPPEQKQENKCIRLLSSLCVCLPEQNEALKSVAAGLWAFTGFGFWMIDACHKMNDGNNDTAAGIIALIDTVLLTYTVGYTYRTDINIRDKLADCYEKLPDCYGSTKKLFAACLRQLSLCTRTSQDDMTVAFVSEGKPRRYYDGTGTTTAGEAGLAQGKAIEEKKTTCCDKVANCCSRLWGLFRSSPEEKQGEASPKGSPQRHSDDTPPGTGNTFFTVPLDDDSTEGATGVAGEGQTGRTSLGGW